jgi:hypothetical protein
MVGYFLKRLAGTFVTVFVTLPFVGGIDNAYQFASRPLKKASLRLCILIHSGHWVIIALRVNFLTSTQTSSLADCHVPLTL